MMLGAIIGDIVGSPFEWSPIKTKDFPLFSQDSHITDDSVMTIAVAQGLIQGKRDPEATKRELICSLQSLGRAHIEVGYGKNFKRWILSDDPKPYNSYGNGSAMRVSPVGWYFHTLAEVERFAAISASVSHNHTEGIKGAQATAAAVFMAKNGAGKDDIQSYIGSAYGYDLDRPLASLRKNYHFDVSCQGSVPEAIIAFLESTGFEDAVRNAVSLGGDSDTQAAIAGSIAECYYGIPDDILEHALPYLEKASLLPYLDRWRDALAPMPR